MLSDTSRMRVPRPPQNRTVFISAAFVGVLCVCSHQSPETVLYLAMPTVDHRLVACVNAGHLRETLSVAAYRVNEPSGVLLLSIREVKQAGLGASIFAIAAFQDAEVTGNTVAVEPGACGIMLIHQGCRSEKGAMYKTRNNTVRSGIWPGMCIARFSWPVGLSEGVPPRLVLD